MKDAQTIGLLERNDNSVKTQPKAATGEFRNTWKNFLPLAVMKHKTNYLTHYTTHDLIGSPHEFFMGAYRIIFWITSSDTV